jgi:hypothetical protein
VEVVTRAQIIGVEGDDGMPQASAGVKVRQGMKCVGQFATCSYSLEQSRTRIGRPDPT